MHCVARRSHFLFIKALLSLIERLVTSCVSHGWVGILHLPPAATRSAATSSRVQVSIRLRLWVASTLPGATCYIIMINMVKPPRKSFGSADPAWNRIAAVVLGPGREPIFVLFLL